MAIAINSTFTAVVPAAYGGSTPVVDLGQSPASISTAVALASAGSVVVSLSGAPLGSVTYTATGLLHEIALAGSASASNEPTPPTQEQQTAGQDILAALGSSEDAFGTASGDASDGVYNGSGTFTPTGSGVSANFASVLKTDPGLSDVAVSDAAAQAVVGTLVSTSA